MCIPLRRCTGRKRKRRNVSRKRTQSSDYLSQEDKFTELIQKKQEKIKLKIHIFEKSVKKQLLGLSIECVQVLRELHRAPLAEQYLVRTCLDVGGALDGSAESASTFEAFHLLFQIIL